MPRSCAPAALTGGTSAPRPVDQFARPIHRTVTWQSNSNLQYLPAGTPRAQFSDPAGHLWLGYAEGTVAHIHDGRAVLFSAAQGLKLGAVFAIHGGRHTFVLGERGLAVLVNGRFQMLPSGMPAFEGVTGIIESRNGDVWLRGAQGLVRIEDGEIDRAAFGSPALAGSLRSIRRKCDGVPLGGRHTLSCRRPIVFAGACGALLCPIDCSRRYAHWERQREQALRTLKGAPRHFLRSLA